MKKTVDINTLLAPIPGDNPSGEELRYTQIYDDIKEARRADDPLDMGDWQREIKTADWDKVISLSLDALENRSKDLQVAAWLTESLIMTEGFGGLALGLKLLAGLLEAFWDTLYPEVEDGDFEYRIAPLEFLNDKVSNTVRQIPLTEPGATAGYSLLKWRESRDVGSDADTKNKYGDVDEQKKRRRDELLAEGRLPAEEFDLAVAKSSPSFFSRLDGDITQCRDAFSALDTIVDEKFGNEAPRLSDLGDTIEECGRLIARLLPAESAAIAEKEAPEPVPASGPAHVEEAEPVVSHVAAAPAASAVSISVDSPKPVASIPGPVVVPVVQEVALQEEVVWKEALKRTEDGKFRETLDWLLSISNSQPSERERNRYRFLVAKLCLKAQRPDLARPIVEQLHALIAELQLERWESPIWIAEVLEALYQCLMSGEPSDDDYSRGNELFRRICTLDVTKVIIYRK